MPKLLTCLINDQNLNLIKHMSVVLDNQGLQSPSGAYFLFDMLHYLKKKNSGLSIDVLGP